MKTLVSTFVAALAFAVPAASWADDIYKSVMRDGTVRYGEAPEYGAKQVKKLAAPPSSTGTITVTAHEKARPVKIEPGTTAFVTPQPRVRPPPAQAGVFQSRSQDLATRSSY